MNRSRFTEEQIIGILREEEGGHQTEDVCRSNVGQCDVERYRLKKMVAAPIAFHRLRRRNLGHLRPTHGGKPPHICVLDTW